MNNKKIPKNFRCYLCDYLTSNSKDYNKHLATRKHIRIAIKNESVLKIPKIYDCVCGKLYKYSSGLSAHKKKCEIINESELIITEKKEEKEESKNENDVATLKEMLFEMIHQNKELQKTITEMIPKIGNTISNNTNNNNTIVVNNLTLLNTNCKDALSLNEFIDSIPVEVKDLMYTSEKGLTTGVANLFLENYNKLPLQKRPLWCSDLKRKKMYIKDGEWQEDVNQTKIKQAIKTLTSKQARSSGKYIQENPDWMKHDKQKDTFVHIVKETTEEMDNIKQTHIIHNLLDDIHLTDAIKTEIKIL